MKNYLIVKIGEVILVISILLFCLAFKVRAQVVPSYIFSNGIVHQCKIEIPAWGTAIAGVSIAVSIKDNSISGGLNTVGKLKVILPAMNAGSPFFLKNVSEIKNLAYSDGYISNF